MSVPAATSGPEPLSVSWIGANRCFGALFNDGETATLFGTEATLEAMLTFERALAHALGAAGAVPGGVVAMALEAMSDFTPDLTTIERAALADGVPAPEFVRQLKSHVRERVGEEALGAVHTGATSQDLLDTGLAMALRDAGTILDRRLAALLDDLAALRERFGGAPLMGRTRMQAALPIQAAHRIDGWVAPLPIHRQRWTELRPRVARVQFGGPVGTRAEPPALANEVARHIANELGLHDAPRAWHTDRSGVVEFGQWLALITGSIGKIGQDIALMAQQGIDAIGLSGGGTSSAMSHKRNPVLAEQLIAQARFASGLAGTLHHAAIHEQERSGTAWALEWMSLPLLCETTGSALLHAGRLVSSIERMGERSDSS